MSRVRVYIFLTLVLSFNQLSQHVFAQSERFQHISADNGLSHKYVFSILPDSLGRIWMGTYDGLNLYNGYEFKVFKSDPDDPYSLSHNWVTTIFKDKNGYMWVGTNGGGLNRLLEPVYIKKQDTIIHRSDWNFESFVYDASDSFSLSSNSITSICQDDYGRLWIGTFGGGLNKMVLDSDGNPRFYHYEAIDDDHESIPVNDIRTLMKDRSGSIWAGTDGGGLFKFMPASKPGKKPDFVLYPRKSSGKYALTNDNIGELEEDGQGNIWIGTRGAGCFILPVDEKDADPEEAMFLKLNNANARDQLTNNIIEDIFHASDGTMWVGTLRGLNKVSGSIEEIKQGETDIINFLTNQDDPYSLHDNQIQTISEDFSGNLWIGTSNAVDKLNLKTKAFRVINNRDEQGPVVDNEINAIERISRGDVWLGTEHGVLTNMSQDRHFFLKNGKIQSLPASLKEQLLKLDENNSGLQFLHERGVRFGDYINSITSDREGSLWIGGVGLYRYDIGKERFNYYHPRMDNHSSSISGWAVWSVIEDNRGDIWIGTSDGLNKYVKDEDLFIHFFAEDNNDNTLKSNKILTLFEDHSGNIWVGTDQGVSFLEASQAERNSTDLTFRSFSYKRNNAGGISSNRIWAFYEDMNEQMWIGTEGAGLNVVNIDSVLMADIVTFKSYGKAEGLAGNVVAGILGDDSGNLWISTDDGLSRFDKENETFRNYYRRDGLSANEFNKGACQKKTDGGLLFGGSNGLTSFYPDSIVDNQIKPEVLISDLKIFNRSVPVGPFGENNRVILEKPLYKTSKVSLNYTDDVLSFEFVALHYADPLSNRYAYKLEPLEEEWNQTDGSRRFANYTNLAPGNYTFKVIASNSDNVWTKEPASIELYISPPFYATWWAYGLYVLLFLFILYSIRSYTINRERLYTKLKLAQLEAARRDEIAQKDQELNQMKLRFFTNISHEFRTPLTLIIGPVDSVLQKISDQDIKQQMKLIKRNASHLLRLVNQLIDFRKLEIGGIQVRAGAYDLIEFLRSTYFSFKYLAEQNDVEFVFLPCEDALKVWFDRDMMEKIFYNLLSNAFKFTPKGGQITLDVQSEKNRNPFLKKNKNENVPRYPFGYVDIKITDTGKGIVPEKLDMIFDRFYQVEVATDSKMGSGIGLALTKELVSLHHGDIFVESEVGVGTTFTVRLPLGKAHFLEEELVQIPEPNEKLPVDSGELTKIDYLYQPPVESAPADMTPAEKFEKNLDLYSEIVDDEPLILIIEDNADLRLYVSLSLQKQFHVHEAEDGQKGLQKAYELIPDLVITDIMMPDMDGYDLCAQLKKDERTAHVPIIMLTALNSDESRIKGIEAGADDYITKPFNTDILNARIDNLVQSRKKLKEQFDQGIILGKDKPEIAALSSDKFFMEKVIELIEGHMNDPDFSVEDFSSELGLSRAQLYRKIKAITGRTISEFVRAMRLRYSAQLLKEGRLHINEIMYRVGFSSQSYFTKCFRQQYGISPKEYANQDKDS